MTLHAATHEVYQMPSAHFDTLAYCKRLKNAGVPEAQAEAHAEALAETVDKNLATKQDIKTLKHDIKELRHDIKTLEKNAKRDIREMSHKIIIWLGSIVI